MTVSSKSQRSDCKALTEFIQAFEAIQEQFSRLLRFAEGFSSHAVAGLIRSAPDIAPHIAHVQGMYHREGDGEFGPSNSIQVDT